jgi:hypothetical protein
MLNCGQLRGSCMALQLNPNSTNLFCPLFTFLQLHSMEFGTIDTETNPAFCRLRWSVFEDVSHICVVEDLDSPHQELSPFLNHRVAGEPATTIPLREIPIDIDALMAWETSDYERPESLTVHRADGGAVTVGDVVEQLSSYLIANKDDILEATAPCLSMRTQSAGDARNVTSIPALGHYDISDDTRVFFNGFSSEIAVGDVSINVMLWVEGQFGETIDDFWKNGPSEEDLLIEV